MEEKLTQIFSVWGWKGLIIIALVFVLSFLIKWPLKRLAVKKANEGVIADKKIITKWFFVIPIVVSFILTLGCELWTEWGWDFGKIDWTIVSTGTATFAVAPAAIYEWFDNFYKSGQATALVKEAEKEAEPKADDPKKKAWVKKVNKDELKVQKLETKKANIQKKIDALKAKDAEMIKESEPTQKMNVDQFGNATFKK